MMDFTAFLKSGRKYKNVKVSVRNWNDIILQQLSYININISTLKLINSDAIPKFSEIQYQVQRIKGKYKNVKQILIHLKWILKSLTDIQELKNSGISPSQIASIGLSLYSKSIFNEELYRKFQSEFTNIEEIFVIVDNWNGIAPNIENVLKIKKVCFESDDCIEATLSLFQNIEELVIDQCSDSKSVQNLIEMNRSTLKKLSFEFYSPCEDDGYIIPFPLKSLNISTEIDTYADDLILENQTELEYLELNTVLSPEFLKCLENHWAPYLNMKLCNFTNYFHYTEIKESIPNLPMVKHLEISHEHLIHFLPTIKNIETLKVFKSYGYKSKVFQTLNNFEIKYLKHLNIEQFLEEKERKYAFL